MTSFVDIAILTTDAARIPARVLAAARNQRGVAARVRFIDGTPLPEETHRWETIVRARNHAVQTCSSDWLMFLDGEIARRHHLVYR